ncbi:unnamed protein product [Polarella glacialis]|uniref:C3H1-type domain-containing protein n=1 Tax=Polarella glacialis TaxID=89957 RepID=A0A813JI98_POLGL|nr:unnamed protein product [Polarella glacialis]
MQYIQVKNTFIHIHVASDEVEGDLRRSSSSPAILQTPWMGTSPVKSCLLKEKLLAHRLGKCKPCGHFYFKVGGCRQGDDCEFCHFCSLDDVTDWKRSGKRQAKSQAKAVKRAAGYMAPFQYQSRSDSSRFSRPSIPTWHCPGAIPRSAPLPWVCL